MSTLTITKDDSLRYHKLTLSYEISGDLPNYYYPKNLSKLLMRHYESMVEIQI